MSHLETLDAVARFSFLSQDIKHGVNQLCSLGVVTLRPVITGSSLSEHEVVRAEKLTERTSSHGVHGSRLQIHQNRTRHVSSSSSFVKIHTNSLQLQIGISSVCPSRIDTMLIGDDFPELSSDLIAALASLNVNDFSHIFLFFEMQ